MAEFVVKCCGMRDPDNIRSVAAAGVTHLGFIHFPGSPRHCTLEQLEVGLNAVPDGVATVLVTVDLPRMQMDRVLETLRPDVLQLHGNESPDYALNFSDGCQIWKVFRMDSATDLNEAEAYASVADALLLDTRTEKPGGSGRTFDWSLVANYSGTLPFILSGGIGPDQVHALNQFKHPKWTGIDVNSRFETAPALKDAQAIHSFTASLQFSS